jgi:hypothetical protein
MINKINQVRWRSMNTSPTIQQQEPMARSPGGLQTESGQRTREIIGRLITKSYIRNKPVTISEQQILMLND